MSVNLGGMKRLNPYLEVKEEVEDLKVDVINLIPDDVLILILNKLNPTTATSCLLTCKRAQILHAKENPLKFVVFKNFAFAPPHWNTYSEKSVVSEEESIKSLNTLDPDTHKQILKNKEKCLLFYIPEKLGEEEMTGTLFREYLIKNKIFTINHDSFFKGFLENKIKSGWIFMMEEILPETPKEILVKKPYLYSNLDYFNEKQTLKFTKPELIGVLIGVYTKFLKTGVLHLQNDLTNCNESYRLIGKFTRYTATFRLNTDLIKQKAGVVAYHRFKHTENKTV